MSICINVGDIENAEEKIEEQFRIYAYIEDVPDASLFVEVVVVKDEYEKAIRDEDLFYTCNCGWIDKTHAFTNTKRTECYIGAKNLWSQILDESGLTSNHPNEQGFQVVYRQDATMIQNVPIINKPFRPGVTKSYFVKKGLSTKEKEQVALTIFQEVSVDFEEFQSFGAVIGKGDSSFEPSDLISNLISRSLRAT